MATSLWKKQRWPAHLGALKKHPGPYSSFYRHPVDLQYFMLVETLPDPNAFLPRTILLMSTSIGTTRLWRFWEHPPILLDAKYLHLHLTRQTSFNRHYIVYIGHCFTSWFIHSTCLARWFLDHDNCWRYFRYYSYFIVDSSLKHVTKLRSEAKWDRWVQVYAEL